MFEYGDIPILFDYLQFSFYLLCEYNFENASANHRINIFS